VTQHGTDRIDVFKDFRSQHIPNERDIFVYRPPGYENDPDRRYPLLLMQDGQNIWSTSPNFPTGWRLHQAADTLIASVEIEPLMICGIGFTSARSEEYVSKAVGQPGRTDGAARYGRMVVEEVLPFVADRYRLSGDPANTFIGGSSFGALAVIDLGLTYPDTFGAIVLESIGVQGGLVQAIGRLGGKQPWRVWQEVGTNEWVGNPKSTAEYLRLNRQLRNAFLAQGWTEGPNFHYAEVPGGRHDEPTWASRMPDLLRWLVPASENGAEPQ